MTTTAHPPAQRSGQAEPPRSSPRHQRRQLVRHRPAGHGPPAHVLLPAARCVRPAADHRPDHGAERVQRLLLQGARRRLLRRRQAAADVGGARHPLRVDRLAAALPRDPPVVLGRDPRRRGAPGAHPDPARHHGQRQHQLARDRPGADPALGDRQARDRAVGRPRLRQQGPPARQPAPDHDAGGAGHPRDRGAGRHRPRPRHGAGAVRDPAGDAVGGRRARPAVHRGADRDRHRRDLPRLDQRGAARAAHQLRRSRSRTTTTRAGSPPTASTPCPPAAGSARASAPASRSGATCPRPTPTSSSRCSARSSAWSARSWSSCSSW